MILKRIHFIKALAISSFFNDVRSFVDINFPSSMRQENVRTGNSISTTNLFSSQSSSDTDTSIWENLAKTFFSDDDLSNDFERSKSYTNTISLLRVGMPSFFISASAKISYPFVAIALANAIDDSGVFAVVSQDASQYIQNILTTSGLTFSILVGQTYYFMYQVRMNERNCTEFSSG